MSTNINFTVLEKSSSHYMHMHLHVLLHRYAMHGNFSSVMSCSTVCTMSFNVMKLERVTSLAVTFKMTCHLKTSYKIRQSKCFEVMDVYVFQLLMTTKNNIQKNI
jgi:hypothetical protein